VKPKTALNLSAARRDQHWMLWLIWLAIAVLCAYGAYRCIRGGFARPQPERLTRYGIGACFLLAALAAAWIVHLVEQQRERLAMSVGNGYPYVYVNADGTARELHASERTYLETEFTGGDGAMPYIKDSYYERNGWGELSGYLKRSRVPVGTAVRASPAEDPRRPMTREEEIAWWRSKGVEVVEHSDGSYTMLPKPRP
jgi:hypothetical protein